MSIIDVKYFVELGQHPRWCQLNETLTKNLTADFMRWPERPKNDVMDGENVLGDDAERIVQFLSYDINQNRDKLDILRNRFAAYSKRYSKSVSEEERRQHVLDYSAELGSTSREVRGDKKAFSRWFGHEAMSERFQRQFLSLERYISFMLDCIGRVTAKALAEQSKTSSYGQVWSRMKLEQTVVPLLDYAGDERVATSAFHALSCALSVLPAKIQHESLSDSALRFVYHETLRGNQSVWVQTEALILLQAISPASLVVALRKRLELPQPDDDLFVRRKVVQIIGEQLQSQPKMLDLLELAVKDQSAAVRQKIPVALLKADLKVIEQHYPVLLFDDVSKQVRASALLGLYDILLCKQRFELALNYLMQSLRTEPDGFVLRVALKVCREGFTTLSQGDDKQQAQQFLSQLLPEIERLHHSAPALSVRRWAAQARDYLLVCSESGLHERLLELSAFSKTIAPGKSCRLPDELMPESKAILGRLLSVIAQDDFGFDVEWGLRGCYINRGHAFGFRLWRLIHEFRHPSSDKRQAYKHTRGRLFWGTMRVPSGILSELAETKVPGEPLYDGDEQGWRGYLPLVDEVISALDLGDKVTTFYHSEGVTEINPPANWWSRKLASLKISWKFAEYARLRNWEEGGQEPANRYLKALEKLGIVVSYKGHASIEEVVSEDPAVRRFFPAVFPVSFSMADLQQFWHEFKDYFVSVYENSLYELVVFMLVVVSYFIVSHLFSYREMKQARDRLPLVLGGWGTRGKSGTERIKAALMNALGYSVISKTTGCEAMFIHAHPFGQLREMFLFRPYDKATIWEQHNLVCLADKLSCEVFLWECMGLTPSYIYILQRQWMRDDIATITNTYPDHEDLQGPAGINIPEVMTEFIPDNSQLITSEEQMLPVLEVAARQRNTQFRSIGWLEAGLLTDDVLERFPYDEHPFNIALVMAMGDELGVDYDYSLKEMADRVVADIGVLKTFPCASIASRRIEFINGMSANERFGCLGNWTRMGLDKVNHEKNPDTWVTIVINNRADRLARSRVFASIVVKDLSFDRCILIGNNQPGFISYVKESWEEWVSTVHLSVSDEKACDILLRMATRFRIPHSQEMVNTRFELMLKEQTGDVNLDVLLAVIDQPEALAEALEEQGISHAEAILAYVEKDQQLHESYQQFFAKLEENDGNTEQHQEEFEQLLWTWLECKIVPIEDYYASGNEVIETIANETPPSFYSRVIGMQNIKGTGLDFVYCWQAWEQCHKACQQLLSQSPVESELGLRALSSFQDYGYLSEKMVRDTVTRMKESVLAQSEHYQASLSLILSNLDRSLTNIRGSKGEGGEANGWKAIINSMVEDFLDAGDAVKRRKKADLIYQDLIDERIGHERAAMELQILNKRQKGGWLNIFKGYIR